MVVKKGVKKKKSRGNSDVSIKVRNADKIISATRDVAVCNYRYRGGQCWIFGASLAMILSYERSMSILWAIFHGVLSWIYVLYRGIQSLGCF